MKRRMNMPEILNLLETFFSRPYEIEVLGELISTVITYNNDKFGFIKKVPEDLKRQLDKVNIPRATVDEAIERAARKILESSNFKVSSAFGNKDLTIRPQKADDSLNTLNSTLVQLINDAEPNKIITIEETLGDGLLRANGGLAGAVGNLFVRDENSKLMLPYYKKRFN